MLKGINGLLDKPHYNWYEYLVIVILCLLFLIYLEFFDLTSVYYLFFFDLVYNGHLNICFADENKVYSQKLKGNIPLNPTKFKGNCEH